MSDTNTDRIAGQQEGIKQSQTILVAAVSIIAGVLIAAIAVVVALQIFTFQRIDGVEARLSARIDSTDGKIDALPQRLSDEFRSMRAETAAQTAAIANSITAARAVQPQIVILPQSPPPPTGGQPRATNPR